MKQKNSESAWAVLCKELEQAKAVYEAAEAQIACKGGPHTADTKDALKDSLQASKCMTEVLEKMRKLQTGKD